MAAPCAWLTSSRTRDVQRSLRVSLAVELFRVQSFDYDGFAFGKIYVDVAGFDDAMLSALREGFRVVPLCKLEGVV